MLQTRFGISERRACRVVGQPRCVQRYQAIRRDELLNGEIFYTLKEAKVLIERWRVHYNTKRPHSSLGYHPPAPETVAAGPPSASLRPAQLQHANTKGLT